MIPNEPDPLRRIPTKRTEVRAEVGSVLRAARLKGDQSLETVAQQTRIPKRYLDALENDRLDEFPAFVYMRGFLKSYCDYLDIPFDELWAKVEASSPPSEAAPAAPAAPPRPTAPPHSPAMSAPPAAAAVPDPEPAPRTGTGAIVLAVTLAAALGVLIFKNPRPREAAHVPANTPRALMPLPRTIESKVVLRALDDAWVRVLVDDAVVFEGRLPRGAEMEWKPTKIVSLRTTDPASLQFLLNGTPQPLTNPSPDGEYRIDVP